MSRSVMTLASGLALSLVLLEGCTDPKQPAAVNQNVHSVGGQSAALKGGSEEFASNQRPKDQAQHSFASSSDQMGTIVVGQPVQGVDSGRNHVSPSVAGQASPPASARQNLTDSAGTNGKGWSRLQLRAPREADSPAGGRKAVTGAISTS
jgi:hypothetical protein